MVEPPSPTMQQSLRAVLSIQRHLRLPAKCNLNPAAIAAISVGTTDQDGELAVDQGGGKLPHSADVADVADLANRSSP